MHGTHFGDKQLAEQYLAFEQDITIVETIRYIAQSGCEQANDTRSNIQTGKGREILQVCMCTGVRANLHNVYVSVYVYVYVDMYAYVHLYLYA